MNETIWNDYCRETFCIAEAYRRGNRVAAANATNRLAAANNDNQPVTEKERASISSLSRVRRIAWYRVSS